jgi:hypothetical protein
MGKETCAILQPHYLPWLGYFEMIDRVDTFVFLDDVQYEDRGWQNRNRIRKSLNSDEIKWLTVPVVKANRRSTQLKDIEVCHHENWAVRHQNAVYQSYKHARFADDLFDLVARWVAHGQDDSPFLADLNIQIISSITRFLGIKTKLVRSSTLTVSGKKTDKLVGICETLGARSYVANNGSMPYIVPNKFEKKGIDFVFQNFRHPIYDQGKLGFLSHLSILDVLLCCGHNSIDIMRVGRPKDWRLSERGG